MSIANHALYMIATLCLLNSAPTLRAILGLVLPFPLEKVIVALQLGLVRLACFVFMRYRMTGGAQQGPAGDAFHGIPLFRNSIDVQTVGHWAVSKLFRLALDVCIEGCLQKLLESLKAQGCSEFWQTEDTLAFTSRPKTSNRDGISVDRQALICETTAAIGVAASGGVGIILRLTPANSASWCFMWLFSTVSDVLARMTAYEVFVVLRNFSPVECVIGFRGHRRGPPWNFFNVPDSGTRSKVNIGSW